MTAHKVLAIIFALTLLFLGVHFIVAYGATPPQSGEIILIPSEVPSPLSSLPPQRPTRHPDAAGIMETCPDGTEILMELWDTEDLGFLYAQGKTTKRVLIAIIHWGEQGYMDIAWFNGRTWTREAFLKDYKDPCDLVKVR